MKVFRGKKAHNFAEGALLALREAGATDMAPEVAILFASAVPGRRLEAEAQERVSRVLRQHYGKEPGWSGEQWLIPVPSLRFDARGLPSLAAECQVYVVAAGVVKPGWGSRVYPVTVVGPLAKPFTLSLPFVFLQALLDEDLDRFPVVTKDGEHTSWEVPGHKGSVQLPNGFVTQLGATLRRMPLAGWLEKFGTPGRSLAPLVVGAMLGWQSRPPEGSAPGQEPYTWEALQGTLESMGFTTRERQIMCGRASPDLRRGMTLEEALKVVLRQR